MSKAIRYPSEFSSRQRQNAEAFKDTNFLHAIYFEMSAKVGSKVLGTIPRNSIIAQPTFIHILEPFNGDNIWIKVGTALNIESIGKVLSHNTGIFQLQNSGFGSTPSDYGVVFDADKVIVASVVPEVPSSNGVVTRGSMFGLLYYTDLSQVEGF